MSKIATVLNEEIVRLSRKECRRQIEPIRKATTQMRREVVTLKRQVAQLERQVAMLSRRAIGAASTKTDTNTKPARFSAKGLRAQRSRLDLSAADFGKLLGVSAQSIYNWESEKARPRVEQIAKLGALRRLGKREVAARLESIGEGIALRQRRTSTGGGPAGGLIRRSKSQV